MVMVKLKMRAVYKTFLSLIGFFILVAAITGILYLFYDKIVEFDSDIEVTGNLSINYIDGKSFNVEDATTIKFSVTNGSDRVNYYNIGFAQIRGNGSYKLLYNDSIVTEGKLTSIDEITTDFISIDSEETKLYTLEITNNDDSVLKGILNIRAQESKIITFSDTILKNNPPSPNSLTDVGTEVANENEGLIKGNDDMGVSYYFRGNVNNNYVSFGELTWRIVRINGDGTVRLILDGVTDTISSYYTSDNIVFDFEDANINTYLESWLNDNLADYVDYIANTKYCNDITYDDIYNFNSYARIVTNKIPTLNCLGNSFNDNIGLLTADEVSFAGGSSELSNKNYYLYNSEIKDSWYTMTGARGTESNINMFMVDTSGSLKTNITGNLYRNVRPVINLIKNIEVEGDGTSSNPYKMKEQN
ncbi:MAG: hypothetical protein E7161_03860 [Firmicutes bacterium]|nr:hypothetical protein [Bacillota bacterium]